MQIVSLILRLTRPALILALLGGSLCLSLVATGLYSAHAAQLSGEISSPSLDQLDARASTFSRFALNVPQSSPAVPHNYAWHTFHGSSSVYGDYGEAIAVDTNGNIYIAGTSYETWGGISAPPLHASSGWEEIVVTKLNRYGIYQWHTFYGSPFNDQGHDIAVDEDGNVYVAGQSNATWQGDNNADPLHASSGCNECSWNLVVFKLNTNGVYQWHTFYGSPSGDAEGHGIAVDGNNRVYVAGDSSATWQGDNNTGPLHAHSGGWDLLAMQLSVNGVYQWHTFYGGSDADFGSSIARDTDGGIYISGTNGAAWQGDNNADPLHAHSGGPDLVVLKLNGTGTYQWHTFYGSASADEAADLAVDGSRNVYIAGRSFATWQGDNGTGPLHVYNGKTDIVIAKLDNSGAYQWHTFYGSSGGHDFGLAIAVDGSGDAYLTGSSETTWLGDNNTNPLRNNGNLVVAKLNSSGAYQWHTFYGSTTGASGYAITADDNSNIYVTGFSGAAWLGDNNTRPLHAYSGGSDIVVLKLWLPTNWLFLPVVMKN